MNHTLKHQLKGLLCRLGYDVRKRYPGPSAPASRNADNGLGFDAAEYQERVRYLEFQVSRLSSLLRLLAGPKINDLPVAQQTRASFDFQWDELPTGRWNLNHPEFRKEAPDYVCEFTRLPREWFKDKKIIDIGCGAGRYSWAMCQLGAQVLSVDQSAHGIECAAQVCSEFPGHRTKAVNLLNNLEIEERFDLVWSFGVLHHTGDTYGAFQRIVSLVKPGGYLFLMLYGEPRPGELGDYRAVNEYEMWRRCTFNASFADRLEMIQQGMKRGEFQVNGDEYIEGYFDAISPRINDLYTFEEIEGWLITAGFTDIRRTVNTRNIHIIARRPDGSANQS